MKIKQSKIGISTAFVVALATVLSGCAKDAPIQYRYGLFSSKVISDQCEIEDMVKRYFSSGEFGNVPRRSPSTFKEVFWGDILAYSGDEVEYYEVRYENRYIHLVQYVASQENFRFKPGCSTVMDIEMSTFSAHHDRFVRIGSSQVYKFRANESNQLCLYETSGGEAFLLSALAEACVNVMDLGTNFDVEIKFSPEYTKHH